MGYNIICDYCGKNVLVRNKNARFCNKSCNKKNQLIAQKAKNFEKRKTPVFVQSLDGELWRPVVGYELLYQVSNFGRFKTVERIRIHPAKGEQLKRERLLSIFKRDGYGNVCLIKDGVEKRTGIHRLVAEVFIPNPENKPFVNHIDFNRSNNCVDNLEWVTQKENIAHSIRHNRHNCGERNGHAKHTEEMVKEIKYIHKRGICTIIELMRIYNYTDSSSLYLIVNGKTWKHLK